MMPESYAFLQVWVVLEIAIFLILKLIFENMTIFLILQVASNYNLFFAG